MRKAVRDLAESLAKAHLESLEYDSIGAMEQVFDVELSYDEVVWVYEAVTGAAVRITKE